MKEIIGPKMILSNKFLLILFSYMFFILLYALPITKLTPENNMKTRHICSNTFINEKYLWCTVKKINLIQIWYLESRIQYLEFRTFLLIKFS